MKVEYRKRFLKELTRIPASHRRNIERFVFEEFPALKSISDSNKIESMKGFPNHFKARFGDYRIGFRLVGNTIVFERALHRKEIYRYFT